jgi:hypothetical protein
MVIEMKRRSIEHKLFEYLFSHVLTVSIQTFVPSFHKFKHSFTVIFLSKGCEVSNNCSYFFFRQCVSRTLIPRSFLIKPSTMTQFSSECEVLVCLCVSLHHNSMPLGHLWIYFIPKRRSFGWKLSGRKHTLTCYESLSDSLLFAEM